MKYLLYLAAAGCALAQTTATLPHLELHGSATQLWLDNHPLLIRGGELNNSSATNPAYLNAYWEKLHALNLNTLVAPVYWDLIQPEENRFDFTTLDQLIAGAREHDLHLVLLWFGSWKNSMSCYAPAWIKRDTHRFPRAANLDGTPQEILTPFSDENLRADETAFSTLLRHIKEVDGTRHTVVMVQVENEVGMIPTARDHCAAADAAFRSPVPAELIQYLTAHRDELSSEISNAWKTNGQKQSGTWPEVFGDTSAGEEIFMAWHFARYINSVASAGKKEYPLPMYVNAALIRPGYQPGQYPSAGPLPHLMAIWKAGAPAIDLLAPDIYFQNFSEWARRFKRPDNALFIPENMRSNEASVNGLYAFGSLDALGYSPFAIETITDPAAKYLTESFDVVRQLEPLILAHEGDGTMAGLLPEGPEQKQPQQVRLGNMILHASFEKTATVALADGAVATTYNPNALPPSGGIVIQLSDEEFVIAGIGIIVTFESAKPKDIVGIASAEEGKYINGQWQNTLWLGGDQTHQGRHIHLEQGRFSIQRVKLYHY